MSLSSHQQFEELLKKTTAPLILLPCYPTHDDLVTAFALALFLQSTGKTPVIAGDTIEKNWEAIAFLGTPEHLLSRITGARDFVLSFNTKHNKITNIHTETIGDELRIYLTPQNGAIDPRDFSFIPAKFKYDLAIVIGAPDKEHLGKIYEENPDIFYELPIINIDRHSGNELFGQINIVDMTASSNAEVLAEVFEKSTWAKLNEQIRECLLAGIITATESFQKKNTTPKALQIASRLMDHGADQQKIIRALYKTQPLHLLKLWGRVMAQVKWNEDLKLIWALVSIEDLVQARAHTDDLPQVLEKIRLNYSSGHYFMLLHPEDTMTIRGIIKAASVESLVLLSERFQESVVRGDTLEFHLTTTTLDDAERLMIEKLHALLGAK